MEAWTSAQLLEVHGWVKRVDSAAKKMRDDNGEVSIKNGESLNLIKETDISSVIEGKHAVSTFVLCQGSVMKLKVIFRIIPRGS